MPVAVFADEHLWPARHLWENGFKSLQLPLSYGMVGRGTVRYRSNVRSKIAAACRLLVSLQAACSPCIFRHKRSCLRQAELFAGKFTMSVMRIHGLQAACRRPRFHCGLLDDTVQTYCFVSVSSSLVVFRITPERIMYVCTVGAG